ncbi:MAG: ABC transporter ATP-binding protein/permease [Actinobacteria bacterium]|nr:ABC transporter ATP-binding protein/permease [Actinomycetota bacterium]
MRPSARLEAARRSIVWVLLSRQKSWVKALIGVSIVSLTINLLTAGATRSLVDDAVVDQVVPLGPLVRRLLVLAVIQMCVNFTLRQMSARVTYQLEYHLRVWLYARLMGADPARFDKVATGQLITRTLTDLLLLEQLIRLIPFLVAAVPVLIGLFLFLLFVNVPMTLVTISAVPINAYLVARVRKRLWGLSWMELHQRAEVTSAVDEPVRGIRVVKAFGQEDRERARVAHAAVSAYRFAMTRVRVLAKVDVLLKAVPLVIQAVVLLLGARLVIDERLTIGSFLLFFLLSSAITRFVRLFDEYVSVWYFATSAAGRIKQVLLHARPRVDRRGWPVPDGMQRVELRDVGVEIGGHAVLDSIDLRIASGEMVLVQGPAGAGKSIVAALVAGVLRPTRGQVLVDGSDLEALDAAAVRREVRMVDEEPFLFALSVRENLLFGDNGAAVAGDDELRAALHAAAADEVVDRLEHGLDTVFGDRGMTLSGGQRQRIALARALVARPPVLVLDDALSAVNPAAEVEILRRIRAYSPESAILCISRRRGLETVADRVVQLAPPPSRNGASRAVAGTGASRAVAGTGASGAVAGTGASRIVADTVVDADATIPYDETLAGIVTGITVGDERPEVDDAQCESDERPSVRDLVRPFRVKVATACAALVTLTAADLMPQYVFGSAVDLIEAGDRAGTDVRALLLSVIGLVSAGAAYQFRVTGKKIDQGLLYQLRRRLFRRLTRLGVDFYDRELPGQVAARVVHDLDRLSAFVEADMYRFIIGLALFVMGMIAMLVLSPGVAFLVVAFVGLIVLATVVQVPLAHRAFGTARSLLGSVVARLEEDFSGRYVLTAFGAEGRAAARFSETAWRLREARRRATTMANSYIEVVEFLAASASAIIFWHAGNKVLAETMAVGTLLTLRLLVTEALRPLPNVGDVWQGYLNTRVSFGRLKEPYDPPLLPVVRPDAQPCPPIRTGLAFRDVDFRYPGTKRLALHDVSFEIPVGSTVALVGATGAGKSSIVKLLGRTYDPDSGAVEVDGVDLRDIELASYRDRLGIVPQDAFVFRGTVAYNIAYGKPGATPEEIEAAARQVGAHEILSRLEHGFDTLVEEEGRNLSPVERQLIALSRAWLVKPDILVLDEATSSLDPVAEALVLDAVPALGCTTVLITHREHVAERADLIAVVSDGTVQQVGPARQIVGSGGAYDRLWVAAPRRRRVKQRA